MSRKPTGQQLPPPHVLRRRRDRHAARKQRAIVLSISSAIVLTALKLAVAVHTGSVAVLSEAVHSLTDLIAAAIVFVSLRRAASPPDSRHRYGHEKFENFSAIAEGAIIIVAIGYVMFEAFQRLHQHEVVTTPTLAALVMVASALVNLAVATHLRRVGTQAESAAVLADAQHLLTDVYTSAAAAIGLALVAATGWHFLDSLVALVVSALVVRIGLALIVGSTRVLLDEGLPDEEIATIERVISEGFDGAVGFHRLRTRRAGSRRHIDVHLTLDGNLLLWRAHELAHEVEEAIECALPNVDVLTHIEPHTEEPPPGHDFGPSDRP